MGINLRDYVKSVDELFTWEEAEQLFIAAGYRKKEIVVEGYENLEITDEILQSNQSTHLHPNIELNQGFEIKVRQGAIDSPNLKNVKFDGIKNVQKYTSISMGGVA